VPPMLAEPDIVPVRAFPVLEDEDQLVLAAVERAHAGIVLYPHQMFFSSE
jgi:hypothetical protein